MNKEVIYLEPEDDITDILTKLQGAEQKLVALVPPKKATMLRSAVNMKLVARAAKESDKIAVIVTADPAVVKQAMLAQIPVAKNLQSRPVVPTRENLAEAEKAEQVISEDLGEVGSDVDALPSRTEGLKPAPKGERDTLDLSDRDLEEKSEKSADKQPKDKIVPNFEKYRKWIILGVTAAVAVITLGVWALIFAPSAKIVVVMNTTANNFLESVFFTTNSAEAKPEEGKLWAEQQVYSDKFETEFSATGQEDRGDRATGEVKVSYKLSSTFMGKNIAEEAGGVKISIPTNAKFIASDSGLSYHPTEAAELVWDGKVPGATCTSIPCTLSATITIEADNSGASYDTGARTTWTAGKGWPNVIGSEPPVIASVSAISGGSSKMVTVVTEADINKALEARKNSSDTDGKTILMSQLPKDAVAIEASYNVEVGEVKTVPAAKEEVPENTKVKLTAETKYTIYTVANEQVDAYIKAATNLGEDQKIYSISDIYFERFVKIEEVARLKAVVKTGPMVTEEDIIARSKGRKNGEVQSLLRSINGVNSAKVEPSYFWVNTVPNDPERITVELTVEDK